MSCWAMDMPRRRRGSSAALAGALAAAARASTRCTKFRPALDALVRALGQQGVDERLQVRQVGVQARIDAPGGVPARVPLGASPSDSCTAPAARLNAARR